MPNEKSWSELKRSVENKKWIKNCWWPQQAVLTLAESSLICLYYIVSGGQCCFSTQAKSGE